MDSLRRVTDLVGSSNGLLYLKLGYEEDYPPPPPLLLLNPATREVRLLPKSTNAHGPLCTVDSGFGYSHDVKDYKIVTIHRVTNPNPNALACVDLVEVFSLRTGSWKEVEFGIIRCIDLYSESVTVNGAIFWLGWHCRDLRVMIVSFDLTEEIFKLISIPFPTSICEYNNLGVYENKVAMYLLYKEHEYELRILEEESRADEKSWVWTQKYLTTETLRETLLVFPHLPLLRNEFVCHNVKGDSVFLSNATTNCVLKKSANSLSDCSILAKFVYVETLVSMCDTHIE